MKGERFFSFFFTEKDGFGRRWRVRLTEYTHFFVIILFLL